MSNNSVDLPNSFDRFREIWGWDFEYRQDRNHCPVPVALFAKERRTGRTLSMRRAELLACSKIPFDAGRDTLITDYSGVAELTCCNVLAWPLPHNVLCTYTETNAAINGLDIVGLEQKRPKLREACDLFGINYTMTPERKQHMIDTVINNVEYTEDQWREIEAGNRDDVMIEGELFGAIAQTIDLPAALFRGRYLKPVAAMELRGLPADVGYLRELEENWPALRMYFIQRDDHLHLYDGDGSFREERMEALIEARGWTWPRTPTGKPELKAETLGKMVRRYPELKPFQRLRDQIAELRLGAFLNTIGDDGASRCPIMPFWTRSGRNQPQGRDLAFLLSLPSWTHGVIKPREGWGVAGLDWVAQEPGLAAGLSGDRAMIEDYLTNAGDIHLGFLIRAGLAPLWASKESHREQREAIKPVSLGMSYGMTKHGVAAATGKSLMWAADRLARYHASYRVNTQWRHDVVTQALFDERIVSVLGWPMAVHADTRRRTVLNFPMQAGGADMMRLAAIAAYEAGIHICAPVHDAFWITAPLHELDDAIATMKGIMERAGREVAGINIPVEVAAVVRWPQCLGDVRKPDAKGQAMWVEIKNLLRSGALQEVGHARAS